MTSCESRHGFGPEGHSWQPVSHVTVLDQRVTPGSKHLKGHLAPCVSHVTAYFAILLLDQVPSELSAAGAKRGVRFV